MPQQEGTQTAIATHWLTSMREAAVIERDEMSRLMGRLVMRFPSNRSEANQRTIDFFDRRRVEAECAVQMYDDLLVGAQAPSVSFV